MEDKPTRALKTVHQTYFERYAWQENLFPDFLPRPDTSIIVVLPCYKEPDIRPVLDSLTRAMTADIQVTILVVVNEPQNASAEARATNDHTEAFLRGWESSNGRYCRVILPTKTAGVGLARKIGMDQAARWFTQLGTNGIIVCFDADTICDTDYFTSISKFYDQTRAHAGIVFYEHPLLSNGIVEYELHLRYYVDALRYAGFPFAFQTLGSCITVRSDVYMKQGGMNRRKAGEDFYFLHKIMPLGRFGEINDTTVRPAARLSDRVPFGTGRALYQFELNQSPYRTYDFRCFRLVSELLQGIPQIYDGDLTFSHEIKGFLMQADFPEALKKMKLESPDLLSFKKRFFQWFDGLRVLKMIHFLRDQYYPNIELERALSELNHAYWKFDHWPCELIDRLHLVRHSDRQQNHHFELY